MIKFSSRYTNAVALAGGGMSDTLLCDDSNLKRKVVIKTLKPGVSSSKLQDELAALSSIRSKHVVQVLDIIHDGDGNIIGFVEEYIEGVPLTCAPISDPVVAMRFLYPIACGIADIHAHGRLHRDLKPDNMKFDNEGTLKIFDFGLAKLETTAGTSLLYFSHGYTAPEAFQKNTLGFHEFSRAIDVFAFGAIALWALNQGKLPPEFSTIPSSVPSVGCDFSLLSANLPTPVSAILNSTFNLKPEDRPDMIQVRDRIARHLLYDRHRMLLTYGATDYWLDAGNRTTSLSYGAANIQVRYDGLDFRVTSVSGSVMINNVAASVGTLLKGAAVIVLRDVSGKVSITADVSHPEVMN